MTRFQPRLTIPPNPSPVQVQKQNMLRIRLRRVGKKGAPAYRIVVADSAAPRDGKYIEWIGQYDPKVDPPAITIKKDRAEEWIRRGAQPSEAVRRILEKDGTPAKEDAK